MFLRDFVLCPKAKYDKLAYFLAQQIGIYLFFFKMRKIVIYSQYAEVRALIRGILSDIEAYFVPASSREELFKICQTTKCDS